MTSNSPDHQTYSDVRSDRIAPVSVADFRFVCTVDMQAEGHLASPGSWEPDNLRAMAVAVGVTVAVSSETSVVEGGDVDVACGYLRLDSGNPVVEVVPQLVRVVERGRYVRQLQSGLLWTSLKIYSNVLP